MVVAIFTPPFTTSRLPPLPVEGVVLRFGVRCVLFLLSADAEANHPQYVRKPTTKPKKVSFFVRFLLLGIGK